MPYLINIAPTLKIAITRVTVEVFLDLVVAKALFIIKTCVAVVTLVIWLIRLRGFSPMAQVSHVLVNSMLTTKVPIARITLKVWRIMTSRVHVLLPRLPASWEYAQTCSARRHTEAGAGDA